MQFALVCCTIQKICCLGLHIPKHLAARYTAAIADSGKTLVTGSSILWLGCFLFVSLSGAIWVWLGANSRKSLNMSKSTGEIFPKLDNHDDQRGAKSPIRNLGAQRTHRSFIPSNILGPTSEYVDKHIIIPDNARIMQETYLHV